MKKLRKKRKKKKKKEKNHASDDAKAIVNGDVANYSSWQ
jgi:hypothetical protein